MVQLRNILKSDINKNILRVFSGSALAQLIAFIAIPVVTRLYTKEDLGYYQLFLSVITTLSVISALRYELTIVLPKNKTEGDQLTVIAFLVVTFYTLFLSLLLQFFGDEFFDYLNAGIIKEYVFYVLLGVYMMGIWQVLQFLLIRQKLFTLLAKNRVIQVLITQAIILGVGYYNPKPMVLFLSQIISLLIIVVFTFIKIGVSWKLISFNDMKDLFKKYIKFPLINTPILLLIIYLLLMEKKLIAQIME